MSLEAKTKDIRGTKITVTPFAARRAMGFMYRTIQYFGPGIAAAIGSLKLDNKAGSALDTNIDPAGLSTAVEKLFSLNPGKFEEYVLDAFLTTRIDGNAIDSGEMFDLHLSGKIDLIPEMLIFVWEVNGLPLSKIRSSIGNRIEENLRSSQSGESGSSENG